LIQPTCVVCAKFDNSRFSSHSRDATGHEKFKMDHMTMTTPLFGVVCHPWAGTCYVQNLKSLPPAITKTGKAMQKVENGVICVS